MAQLITNVNDTHHEYKVEQYRINPNIRLKVLISLLCKHIQNPFEGNTK
jgi:hypothetical protein